MVTGKMKRQFLLMAAVASVAATTLSFAGPAAAADDDRGGRGRAERSEGRGRGQERGGERRAEPERGPRRSQGEERAPAPPAARAPRYSDDGPRYVDERPRYEERRGGAERPNYMQGPRPSYMAPPPGAAARRGYLPDTYRGDVIENYQRYRLRPPPHGYAWVRMGNGFALVEMGSGRIFDRVD